MMFNSRSVRLEGHVAQLIMRNVRNILVGKLEGKRTLEKPRCRWKNSIKIESMGNMLGG